MKEDKKKEENLYNMYGKRVVQTWLNMWRFYYNIT